MVVGSVLPTPKQLMVGKTWRVRPRRCSGAIASLLSALRTANCGCISPPFDKLPPSAFVLLRSPQDLDASMAAAMELRCLIEDSDVVFALTDTRESRWLPTLLCRASNTPLINEALGFDSWLVMRHGLDATRPVSGALAPARAPEAAEATPAPAAAADSPEATRPTAAAASADAGCRAGAAPTVGC